jgi:N-acetylglucosaminyldiphosphoundecaprenol N-acetyl-beta-D-mannosaminyltransferase
MVAVTQLSMRQDHRVRIGRIGFDPVTEAQVVERIEELIRSGAPNHVVTANLRFLTLARGDEKFANVVNNSALVVADGMPVIWASKIAGDSIPARVTGGTVLDACAKLAVKNGYSLFLLGARPGVADEAAAKLAERYPGLKIAGVQHGYFGKDENAAVVARIREAKPEFLFVAMGCPKQEWWISENLAELQVPVCVGIGGTLEIVTGRLMRAPKWMQSAGLEWIYRLAQEPGRLWKRYLLEDVPTGVRIGMSAVWRRVSGRR